MIEVSQLDVWFPIRKGVFSRVVDQVRAVQSVSFSIPKGELFSVVGESGSGKSTLGNALLGLIDVTSGSVRWNGNEFFTNSKQPSRSHRRLFQMIYQDSNSSLNPRKTIYETLAEPMIYHKLCKRSEAKDKVAYLLEMVQLEADMMSRFPFAFSGGQRQRINIARTLGVEPEFIVCDEVVSALDVSIQAQILELIMGLKERLNLTLMFIGHDLAVVKNISDRIMVMNQGRIEEIGTPEELFTHPQTDYTKKLLSAVPSLDLSRRKRRL